MYAYFKKEKKVSRKEKLRLKNQYPSNKDF